MSESRNKNQENVEISFFQISMVAEMVSTHPQTLRMYERLGLVTPQRTPSNIRMYSQEDVDRVRRIQHLTRQLGVNLAGVEVVFKLLNELEKVRAESEAIIDEMQRSHLESWSQVELRRHAAEGEDAAAIVPAPPARAALKAGARRQSG